MKIIGGKDYYDGAGMGVDESIMFVRNDRFIDANVPMFGPLYRYRGIASYNYFETFFVIFAGEIYPGAELIFGEEYSPKPIFYYNVDEAIGGVKKLRGIDPKGKLPPYIIEELHQHFSKKLTKKEVGWIVANQVKLAIFKISDATKGHIRKEYTFVADGDFLKDFDFYKVVDPFTAHMRLSNWIGGVLPSGPEVVGISDKSKIVKAGFDVVTSFRQPKGVKKPRKRRISNSKG